LQYVVTAALLFAALWIAAVFLLRAPFASVDVPVLGPIPTPLVVLASLLLAGYLLARLLGAHAGMLGRRWARGLRGDLTRELETRLRDVLFVRLDDIDAARGRIASARETIERAASATERRLRTRWNDGVLEDCLLLSVEAVDMKRLAA